LEDHTANDTHRTDKIWEEVQEAHKEFVDELGEMGSKQRDLEQRWQESNEVLRGRGLHSLTSELNLRTVGIHRSR